MIGMYGPPPFLTISLLRGGLLGTLPEFRGLKMLDPFALYEFGWGFRSVRFPGDIADTACRGRSSFTLLRSPGALFWDMGRSSIRKRSWLEVEPRAEVYDVIGGPFKECGRQRVSCLTSSTAAKGILSLIGKTPSCEKAEDLVFVRRGPRGASPKVRSDMGETIFVGVLAFVGVAGLESYRFDSNGNPFAEMVLPFLCGPSVR